MTDLVTRRPRTCTLLGSALGASVGAGVGLATGALLLSLLVGAILGVLAAELVYNAATVPAAQRRTVTVTTGMIMVSGLVLTLLLVLG